MTRALLNQTASFRRDVADAWRSMFMAALDEPHWAWRWMARLIVAAWVLGTLYVVYWLCAVAWYL